MAVSRSAFGLEKTTALGVFVLGGAALFACARWVTVPGARAPGKPAAASEVRRGAPDLAVVTVAGLPADGALRERLVLSDPRPLFLPAGDGVDLVAPEPVSVLSGGRVVDAFPPALRFAETAPARDVLRPLPPASPVEAAVFLAASRWFSGLARQGSAVSPLPGSAGRLARVEVYRANEAGRITAVDIVRAAGLESSVWKPLTLTVLVEAAGAVALPAVAVSSGVDEVDERIRWIVGRELLPTLSLRPGVYRLEIGP